MKYFNTQLGTLFLLVGCQATPTPEANEKPAVVPKELTLEQFCKSNPCRRNKHIKFNTDAGMVDQILPLYWPAAQDNQLSILPGDELLIEAEIIADDRLGQFKLVSEMVNPNKTIRFSFKQMESNNGMMLSVKNPFPFNIKYHLNMIDFSGKQHQTSSCPVRANLSVFETWPHPIPELVLTEMRIQKQGSDTRCVY